MYKKSDKNDMSIWKDKKIWRKFGLVEGFLCTAFGAVAAVILLWIDFHQGHVDIESARTKNEGSRIVNEFSKLQMEIDLFDRISNESDPIKKKALLSMAEVELRDPMWVKYLRDKLNMELEEKKRKDAQESELEGENRLLHLKVISKKNENDKLLNRIDSLYREIENLALKNRNLKKQLNVAKTVKERRKYFVIVEYIEGYSRSNVENFSLKVSGDINPNIRPILASPGHPDLYILHADYGEYWYIQASHPIVKELRVIEIFSTQQYSKNLRPYELSRTMLDFRCIKYDNLTFGRCFYGIPEITVTANKRALSIKNLMNLDSSMKHFLNRREQ